MRPEKDRSWVTNRDQIQNNCEAFAKAIEQGLPEELNFVLLLFPKDQRVGVAMAGRGKAAEVGKALRAGLESANRARNEGSRLVLPT